MVLPVNFESIKNVMGFCLDKAGIIDSRSHAQFHCYRCLEPRKWKLSQTWKSSGTLETSNNVLQLGIELLASTSSFELIWLHVFFFNFFVGNIVICPLHLRMNWNTRFLFYQNAKSSYQINYKEVDWSRSPPEWPFKKLPTHTMLKHTYVYTNNVPKSIFAQLNWFNKFNSSNKIPFRLLNDSLDTTQKNLPISMPRRRCWKLIAACFSQFSIYLVCSSYSLKLNNGEKEKNAFQADLFQ